MEVKAATTTSQSGAILQKAFAGSASSFTKLLRGAAVGPDTASEGGGSTVFEARSAVANFDLSLRADDPASASTYVGAAHQVSIVQGLPAGVYDFTAITPRQMSIVGGALIAGGIVRPAGIAGALDLAAEASTTDTPVNFFAYLHQQAGENEKSAGGMSVAFQQRNAIATLTRLQSASDMPITFDQNYPTAPRAPTAAEMDSKMKDAIAAFTKEASLTPAQRIRRDVLKDMKITENDIKAMPQAERDAAEKKIGEEVLRRLETIGAAQDADDRQA